MENLSKGGNNVLGQPRDNSKRALRKFHSDGHVPNKNEAKLLRKLMSETGMSEAELRKDKKYRVMLSQAQKVPAAKTSPLVKIKKTIMKDVTKELKLAKEHPLVQAEFKTRWNKWASNLSSSRKLRLGIK